MSYFITHRYRGTERDPPGGSFAALLAELDDRPGDKEHGSVSIQHESGWTLGIHRDGYVIFENMEEGTPRHMRGVPREKLISMMETLATGDMAALEGESWSAGY